MRDSKDVQMKSTARVLMLGDLVGFAGISMFVKHMPRLKDRYNPDFVVVNGENSAPNGRGITPKIAETLLAHGADVITTGNHVWNQREIYAFIQENRHVLRPANFPAGSPGVGVVTIVKNGVSLGVINVQGRVFMRELSACPFRTIDSALTLLKSQTSMVVVDVHAEATAEKAALAYYVDGRVSAIVGTHTHVQTADERILPGGTAFLTDLGMGGALNSNIGMKKEAVIQNFLTQMPTKFEVDYEPPMQLCGLALEINTTTGKTISVERIRIIDNDIVVQEKFYS